MTCRLWYSNEVISSWISITCCGSIGTKGRGLLHVQVCWNRTNWHRLGYRRFSFRRPFLKSLSHDGCLFNWSKMAAREHREIHHVEQTKKIAPFITHKIYFSQQVFDLVFGVNIFDLDLGVQILSNNQSNATLWVLDTFLIIGLRPLMIILITASLSSNMYSCASQWQEFAFVATWSRFNNWSTFWLPSFLNLTFDVFAADSRNSSTLPSFAEFFWWMNVILRSPHPTSQEQEYRPFANQHPVILSLILWNCETLMLASCTSNWWEQMFDFREYIRFSLKLILNLPGVPQNLRLEVDPVDNAEPCCSHDKIVCRHVCDECKKSNLPSVFHKLLSTLWLLEQACLLTRECRAHQLVPNPGISRHVENIHQIILRLSNSSFSRLWSSEQGVETLENCCVLFVCPFTLPLDALLSMSFHFVRPRNRFGVELLPPW